MRDRSVNAFALPGGYVGVHLGLIAITVDRDELAVVLAHELSHVTQRHIARSIAQQQAAVAARHRGADRSACWPPAAQRQRRRRQRRHRRRPGRGVQSQLNFSRDMEREADRVGFG